MIREGANVTKVNGSYMWDGVVCSSFVTPDGLERYVVAHPVNSGWVLHIYGANQLRVNE